MPPEVLNELPELRSINKFAADVWSLGINLVTLLTGQVLWTCPNSLKDANFAQFSSGEISILDLITSPHAASPKLFDLLADLLQVNPKQRPTCKHILQHEWMMTPAMRVVFIISSARLISRLASSPLCFIKLLPVTLITFLHTFINNDGED